MFCSGTSGPHAKKILSTPGVKIDLLFKNKTKHSKIPDIFYKILIFPGDQNTRYLFKQIPVISTKIPDDFRSQNTRYFPEKIHTQILDILPRISDILIPGIPVFVSPKIPDVLSKIPDIVQSQK